MSITKRTTGISPLFTILALLYWKFGPRQNI